MGTLRDPVGPQDRSVYLRRRLVVLAALLAIAAAIVLVVLKPGSSGGATGAQNVEIPEDLVPVEQTATEEPADPDQVPACTDAQLAVTPVTDRASYAAGELPQLSLTVENTGEAVCQADLGTATLKYEITSGSDQVWRSTDCQQNPDRRPVLLEPGTPLSTEAIAWDRTRSSPETCDIARDPVFAGGSTYHLRVEAGGVRGAGTAPFLLY